MPGFCISNANIQLVLNNMINSSCVSRQLSSNGFSCSNNTLNKFMNDKLFTENDEFIIILEGIVLNKIQLQEKYSGNNWQNTIIYMIHQSGTMFFKELEGPFSGAVYYKEMQEWCFFTNQSGETPLFYYFDESNSDFIVASQINYITDNISHDKLHLDKRAAIDMLTFAYMEGSETYAAEIKRMPAGGYLLVKKDGSHELDYYHKFDRSKYNVLGKTKEEIINILDEKFRFAVNQEYAKDDEYGYEHLADLSGGLDSRMTTWVAHSLGYTKQQNITFCQADCDDEKIAKQIASYLHHDLLIKPLDDISFMFDAEEIVKMNYGLSLYSGFASGNRLLKSLDVSKYGIEHGGEIGDVVIGSFMNEPEDLNTNTTGGLYSSKFADRLDSKYRQQFSDQELYLIYVRGFHGACCPHMIQANYTPTWSPFLNTDFLEFCLCLPIELRCKHRLYKEWIITKYPEAAQFRWERTGLKLTDGKVHTFLYNVKRYGPAKIARTLGIKFSKAKNKGMNPLDYWYQNNVSLKDYYDQIFSELIGLESFDDELRNMITVLFNTGSCCEKSQVITLLLAIRDYVENN